MMLQLFIFISQKWPQDKPQIVSIFIFFWWEKFQVGMGGGV